MSIRPDNIKKDRNTRLYHVTAKWTEKGKTYRQDFVIAANNEGNALQIGKNHVPLKHVKSASSNLELQVRDYGIPQPNRTYYSSPILPNSYKPVMPGPIDQMPIAENTVEEPDFSDPKPVTRKIEPIPVKLPEIGMTMEEFKWTSYFITCWGTQLGKPIPIREQERPIIKALKQIPDTHMLLRDWCREFLEEPEPNEKNADNFFKKKLAEFIDKEIHIEEEDNEDQT